MKIEDFITTLIFLIILIILCFMALEKAEGSSGMRPGTLTASWYSVESCKKEGSSGIMANGKELKDEEKTCASWDYPFGTKISVTNLRTAETCIVEVTDRGPSRDLYRQGRILDLSKSAFAEIAPLEQGIIPVRVERIK